MAEKTFLTTKTTVWNGCMSPEPPKWIRRDDNFNLEFEGDEEPPLDIKGHLAPAVDRSLCTETHEDVAVKRLPLFANEKTSASLLKSEVDILRGLKHYHCIRVLGSFTQADHFNIITQPVADCDLNDYLFSPGSTKVKKAESTEVSRNILLPRIMGCLAHTLHYIHKEKRVRHRDIKPGNILLKESKVLFADFGLSKTYTTTQSGSSGPSRKTLMYTSPERGLRLRRNPSDDIFSLACVFAEIFTVYKGRSAEEFLNYRKERDTPIEKSGEKNGYFHTTVPAVKEWLDSLVTERCDLQIVQLLHKMFQEPNRRPSAEYVWKVLTTCTALEDKHFCGPCCMPYLQDDPILTHSPRTDPSKAPYASDLSMTNAKRMGTDLHFMKHYGEGQLLDVKWVRNLRYWNRSILDVVRDGNRPNLLTRKRLQASDGKDLDADIYARNEAEILRQVDHRHIVKLHNTYLQGSTYTLLFEPAADFDLCTYLNLVEFKNRGEGTVTKDTKFLTNSFGCLANAVAHLHRAGYDHNDIRPEHILIHEKRILLSKFSFGLKLAEETSASASKSSTIWRFYDNITGILLTKSSSRQAKNDALPKSKSQNMTTGQYRAPGLAKTSVGQPAADIFALGCVFIEILTVIFHRKVEDFESYRANSDGDIAYCNTLQKAHQWLFELNMDGFGGGGRLRDIIRRMTDLEAAVRPKAVEVFQVLSECKNSRGEPFTDDCTA